MNDEDTARDAMRAAQAAAAALHAPVLRVEAIAAADAAGGVAIDGTFGAGGYATALLEAGAARVIGLDRDPDAIARGRGWADLYDGRLELQERRFSELDRAVDPSSARAALLDIGVSSMQIDDADRGFSFMRDGPLDMRMGADGPTAADLTAELAEADLANLLFHYGEERRSRAIARAVVRARGEARIDTTARLAEIVSAVMPPQRPGEPHPATRSFQALRIAVNDELGELVRGLEAAERALEPGGRLVVVTFHSLEDRLVKRFFQERAGSAPQGSRHQPPVNREPATFERIRETRGVAPGEDEIAQNPRARSARLRAAARADAPARPIDRDALARMGAPPPLRDGLRL